MSNHTTFFQNTAFQNKIEDLSRDTRERIELILDAFAHNEITFEQLIEDVSNAAKNAPRKVEV